MKIRKQVYELTLKDLEEYPAWEHCLDEECEEDIDEMTVRPYEFTPPLELGGPMVVVKADFTLADGTKMAGYLCPPMATDRSDVSDLGYIQPHIITEKGQIYFWHGVIEPQKTNIAGSYEMLGKTPEETFPIKYKSAVEREDGPVEGVLEGFYYLKKGLFGRLKTVIVK